MSDTKCKNCGGVVDFDRATGIGTCQYCGTKQAAPQEAADNLQQQINNVSAPNQKHYAPTDKRSKLVMKIIKIALILVAAYFVISLIIVAIMTMSYSG